MDIGGGGGDILPTVGLGEGFMDLADMKRPRYYIQVEDSLRFSPVFQSFLLNRA